MLRKLIKYLTRNKCEFLKDKICSLPNYGCECHYGRNWKRCTAASFFKKFGHTNYAHKSPTVPIGVPERPLEA